MKVRRYRDGDRGRALALLKDARAIDSPGHRLQIAEDGAAYAVALWVRPDAGGPPLLGCVSVSDAGRRDLFYGATLSACQDAIDEGFERGRFVIRDRRLMRRLERDFRISPRALGWEPNTEKAVRWEVEVDLEDALAQLKAVV